MQRLVFLPGLQQRYQRSLLLVLAYKRWVVLAMTLIFGGNIWLYLQLPGGMLPEQDTGQLNGFVRGDDGFSYQVMQPKIEAFRQYLWQDPGYCRYHWRQWWCYGLE